MPASVRARRRRRSPRPRGVTMSAVIILVPGRRRPTTMSASRTTAAMSAVREWARVTVASTPLRARQQGQRQPWHQVWSGRSTTARRPARRVWRSARGGASRRGACIPTRPGRPRTSRPIERSVRPSTSFSGGMRSMTGSGIEPVGQAGVGRRNGSCTRSDRRNEGAHRLIRPRPAAALGRQVDVAGREPGLGGLGVLGCARSGGSGRRRRRAPLRDRSPASRPPRSACATRR